MEIITHYDGDYDFQDLNDRGGNDLTGCIGQLGPRDALVPVSKPAFALPIPFVSGKAFTAECEIPPYRTK